MRKLICEECGKHYDYDVDDFCPKCGAFNRPETKQNVSRVDGINEDNHHASFAHAELHDENRDRRGSGLSQGGRQVPQGGKQVQAQAAKRQTSTAVQQENSKRTEVDGAKLKKVIGFIVGAIIVLNFLPVLLRFLLGF